MTSLVGHGLLVLANGDKYEGMFDNDKKHGHGRFQWGDGPWKGHAYDGEWVSDVMEGKGSYITSMRK